VVHKSHSESRSRREIPPDEGRASVAFVLDQILWVMFGVVDEQWRASLP
jgi:hypothetical protein